MKVIATRPGFYCNTFIEENWVFELLKNPDGTDPIRRDWVPQLDAQGKDTGKGKWVDFKDANGKTRHRDFAPDEGEVMLTEGPVKGDVVQIGWMEEVPEDTEVTIDLAEFRHGFDVESRKLRRQAPKVTKTSRIRSKVPPITRAG